MRFWKYKSDNTSLNNTIQEIQFGKIKSGYTHRTEKSGKYNSENIKSKIYNSELQIETYNTGNKNEQIQSEKGNAVKYKSETRLGRY